MEFLSRFDSPPRRAWRAGLASVLLLLGMAGISAGEPPKDRPADGGLTLATTPDFLELRRNRIILFLTDNGQIGGSGSSVAGGGFWISTTDQYIFSSGPNVGATIPGAGDTVVAIGGPFSELEAGGPTFDALGLDEYYSTANPEDVGNFPDVCTVDQFRIAQFPALQPFAGQPFPGFADETVCLAVNDIQAGTCADCAGTRAGVEIVETIFVFGVPAVQDFAFVVFRIFNRTEFITAENTPAVAAGTVPPGPYDLENTIVAVAIDSDIGEAGDDQIAFFPDVQTMVFWDSDFTEPNFQNPLGFGGITYLKTPIDPATGEEVGLREFTVFTNGPPRPDPSDKEQWYDLMTGGGGEAVLEVDPRDVRGMASSGPFRLPQGEFVEIYAAYFFAGTSGAPPALLLAEGYKNLVTGELDPNANSAPVFDNFRTVQQTAQSVFDAGFVVPTAPPKPDFELIPGDHQVTIVWEADPVESVNPFAKVARDPFARLADGSADPAAEPVLGADGQPLTLAPEQVVFLPQLDEGGTTGFVTAAEGGVAGRTVTNPAFNPGFAIQDFQGFRVYRSRTGSTTDAELIAQFDLADGVRSGLFCGAAQAIFFEEQFVETVCTQTVETNLGTDTGLAFSVVDRGGAFPTPSVGPGLINGIPVFYTVTSFGVNPGQTPVDLPTQEALDALNASVTPALPLVLEAGLAPLEQAIPRSNASSFVNALVSETALVDAEGNVLAQAGLDTQVIPIDTTGTLTGPIPPGEFEVQVSIVQPEAIPADFELNVVIDSVGIGYQDVFHTTVGGLFGVPAPPAFENVHTADQRGRLIYFHLEDSAGNPLSGPTGPSAGVAVTGFIAFTGEAFFSSPVLSVEIAEGEGSAFTVQWSAEIGERNSACSRSGTCTLSTADGGGVPASVANFVIDVGSYGSYSSRAIEITWGRDASGNLTLTRVHDITNNVSVPFVSTFGHDGWGFPVPTGLGPEEQAVLSPAIPRTADGRVVYPDPLYFLLGGQNFGYTTYQAAPDWTALPVEPNILALLAPHGGTQTAPVAQEGVFQQTGTLFTCPASGGAFACAGAGAGKQGTRVWLPNYKWLDLAFNSLPADGETWLLQFPNGVASAPRPPVPGTAIRVQISGGTNDLANADLSAITVVPNPFIAANEITRGRGLQRILFTQLPPQATIRIYTISGNLVRVLEHNDGSGTEPWDVRTRFDLLVASGNYYFHVTTPDGRTHLGRFAVVN